MVPSSDILLFVETRMAQMQVVSKLEFEFRTEFGTAGSEF